MIKHWISVTASGKKKIRIMSMLMALVVAISSLPAGAMAAGGLPVTVSAQNDASSIVVGSSLQMIEDSQLTVTWSVYDVEDGEQLLTQNYASIESETGLLTGLEAGTVRVTARADDGDEGSMDLVVAEQVVVGGLSVSPALQGGDMVTLNKTKFVGIQGNNIFWATSGQTDAEPAINEGTLASELGQYSINLSKNPFVPAAVGQIISVIEVNAGGVVVGFDTFEVLNDGVIGTNKPPVARYDDTGALINQDSLLNIYSLFTDPEGQSMGYSNIKSLNTSVVTATIYPYSSDYMVLRGIQTGTALVSFDVTDSTGDKISHTVEVTAGAQVPYFNRNETSPFTDSSVGIFFQPNSDWVSKITSIEVDGEVIQPENYTITNDKAIATIREDYVTGEILFHEGVLLEGKHRIAVRAEGYTLAIMEQDVYHSEDSYYMTTIVDKTAGSITATAKVVLNLETYDLYNIYDEQATAYFQLMNGDVPVSTVSYTIEDLDDFVTFKANFNLADTATNNNYTVRSFLVAGENSTNDSDVTSMGYNLATIVTKEEFDVLFEEYLDWY
ncbi:MAG: hemoblobin-interacting domain-containing protein [Candidatus Pristimantibacillus sp.]